MRNCYLIVGLDTKNEFSFRMLRSEKKIIMKKRSYTSMRYLFPRHLDRINEREGGGDGGDLSDQSPFTIVVAM